MRSMDRLKVYLFRSLYLTLSDILMAFLLSISMIGIFELSLFARTWLIICLWFFGIPLLFVWSYPIWAIYVMVLHWIAVYLFLNRKGAEEK